jgi:copper chaperone NosL
MPDFRREDLMRFAIAALVALTLVGCTSLQPLPIRAGDTCYACGRVISEPKLAAEMIDAGGRAYKFDTVTCLAKYLVGHPSETPKGTFVTDWSTGKWLPADTATYVRAVVDESTMAKSYYAFRSADAAASFAKEKTSTAVDWTTVQQQVKGN